VQSNPVRHRRKKPVSDVITADEFLRMYKAVATANMQGFVLNTFLTVSWEIGNVKDAGFIESLHERYFASMRTWADDRAKAGGLDSVPFGAIWVKEVGHRLGLHSHFLIHIPAPLFVNFRYWSAKAARRLLELPAPDPRQPPSKLRLTHCSWLGDDVGQQWNVFKYLMKALDADVSVLLDYDHRRFLLKEWADIKPSPQGRISGRRTGSSHSLGPAVRKRLEAVKGATGIWREKHQLDGLPYNDCFLHHGELRQSLMAIEL